MSGKTLKTLDVFECVGKEALIREVRLNKGTKKSIGIFGDAGVGKTDVIHEIAAIEKFDRVFEIRLAGMSSEDILGLPVKITDKEKGEHVKFAKLNWMKEIQDNPNETVLLFLDK